MESADENRMKHAHPAVERLVAAAALALAFLGMASIFIPDRSRAEDDLRSSPLMRPTQSETIVRGVHESSDPHEGLELLGTLEHVSYIVHVYATDLGPRYTVFDHDGESLATLLTAERVADLFPQLPLPAMEFRGGMQLMLAPIGGLDLP